MRTLAAATKKAERSLAGDRLCDLDAAEQGRPLLGAVEKIGMRTPQPTMARRLVASRHDFRSQSRRSLDGASAHEKSRLRTVTLERVEKSPETGAHPVGEHLFLGEVAHSRFDDARDLRDAFIPSVAVADRQFRALLEIDHEGNGDSRAIWPDYRWRAAAIADQVAWSHLVLIRSARR